MDVLHIQLNNYDTYQTPPREIDNLHSEATQVPIIRIYGTLVYPHNDTKAHHNVLIHVHNSYPYVYLNCDLQFVDANPNHLVDITTYLESFIASLIKPSFTSHNLRSHIAKVSLCKGIPIYGYRLGYTLYYKIRFLSPLSRTTFASSIDKLDPSRFSIDPKFKLLVFESHIPFESQFLTDFNLFCCDYIRLSQCYFRSPIFNGHQPLPHLEVYLCPFLTDNIVNYRRMGHSLLEIDITTLHITNRLDLHESELHHKLVEPTQAPVILSSSASIINSLKFHSDITNLGFTFARFTDTKQFPTVWPNDSLLQLLLDYSVILNKPSTHSVATYQQTIIDPVNKAVEKYPTVFQMTGIECDEKPDIVADKTQFDDADQIEGLVDPKDQLEDETDAKMTDQVDDDDEKDNSLHISSYENLDSQILINSQNHRPQPRHLDLGKHNIVKDLELNGLVQINYPDPHYSTPHDISKPIIIANKPIKVPLKQDIPEFKLGDIAVSQYIRNKCTKRSFKMMQYTSYPPTVQEVVDSHIELEKSKRKTYESQLQSASNNLTMSHNEPLDHTTNEFVSLSNFIMELHINTYTNKLPNPHTDEISIAFYKFSCHNGFIVNQLCFPGLQGFQDQGVQVVATEDDIFAALVAKIRHYDPDILSGYEINSLSWGFLIERFKHKGRNIVPDLSKVRLSNAGRVGDRWGYTHTSNIAIVGRYTLNVWRMLQRELNVSSYSFENCCYQVCHMTFPKITNEELTRYLSSQNHHHIQIGIRYYQKKLDIVEYLIASQELISKNEEHSRFIGINFHANYYRGSQFKVESILSRFAKAENYILNSPSKLQVHKMKPLEQVPLIMEPISNFYKSPLLVLDFQSLYPSIIIAYNYCYSTLLGKLHGFDSRKNTIGYLRHVDLDPYIIDLLRKNQGLNVSPNGYVFINQKYRKSLLAKMLLEILELRVNVKRFLASLANNQHRRLFKIFNSRQLALKLIANVTYGYTSATFSGRMPNSDIADCIVATGREILSKSIDLIEQSEFGAKVVYGDTDSLFVYLPGKSKREAFRIGEIFTKSITDMFPDPIKLKLEKVYHPCVLLSKKRYVGHAYEHEDQQEPKFDAKGIETVRRDGIPAQQKILKKSLSILFDTSDLSLVKKYVVGQFTKVLANKVSVQDFCFAKEVRYGTYKNEAYLPPGAIVARRKAEQDERSEPQYRERVPYVVIQDPTKPRLRDRCISPEEFLANLQTDKPFQLDYEYYVTKVLIPPLERIFNLMGCNIQQWYEQVAKPKPQQTIFPTSVCGNCGTNTLDAICSRCRESQSQVIVDNQMQVKRTHEKLNTAMRICDTCIKTNLKTTFDDIRCVNDDCLNYYRIIKYRNAVASVSANTAKVMDLL